MSEYSQKNSSIDEDDDSMNEKESKNGKVLWDKMELDNCKPLDAPCMWEWKIGKYEKRLPLVGCCQVSHPLPPKYSIRKDIIDQATDDNDGRKKEMASDEWKIWGGLVEYIFPRLYLGNKKQKK